MANFLMRRALLDAVRVPAGVRSMSELAKVTSTLFYIFVHFALLIWEEKKFSRFWNNTLFFGFDLTIFHFEIGYGML